MKKQIVRMPHEISSDFETKYFLFVRAGDIKCRCGWSGDRRQLLHEIDIEQMHPRNRNNSQCTLENQRGCHKTAFEKCPKCRRCLLADNNFIG